MSLYKFNGLVKITSVRHYQAHPVSDPWIIIKCPNLSCEHLFINGDFLMLTFEDQIRMLFKRSHMTKAVKTYNNDHQAALMARGTKMYSN